MKKVLVAIALGGLMIGCGGKEKKEEKKEGFEMNRAKTEEKTEAKTDEASQGVPVDMSNKGVGPITSVTFADEIDPAMVSAGAAKFKSICTACHMADKRLIGPALKGVFERRSPEWVMNMIMNPDGMVKEDPIAMALYKEYNNAPMINQNLSESDARAIAEYLRTL